MRQAMLCVSFATICLFLTERSVDAAQCSVQEPIKHVPASAVAYVDEDATTLGCFNVVNRFWRMEKPEVRLVDTLGPFLVAWANRLAYTELKRGNRSASEALWKAAIADNDAYVTLAQRPDAASSSTAMNELIHGNFARSFRGFYDNANSGSIYSLLFDRVLMPTYLPRFIDGLSADTNGSYVVGETIFSRLTRAFPHQKNNPESWFFLGATQLALNSRVSAKASFLECSLRSNNAGPHDEMLVTWTARCSTMLLHML